MASEAQLSAVRAALELSAKRALDSINWTLAEFSPGQKRAIRTYGHMAFMLGHSVATDSVEAVLRKAVRDGEE